MYFVVIILKNQSSTYVIQGGLFVGIVIFGFIFLKIICSLHEIVNIKILVKNFTKMYEVV